MAATDLKNNEKIKQKLQEPKQWKVVLVNDDYTTVDFVISILQSVFKHDEETAKAITMQIHTTGSGIAGIYSFEIAEAKAVETTQLARTANFPLQTKIEEE